MSFLLCLSVSRFYSNRFPLEEISPVICVCVGGVYANAALIELPGGKSSEENGLAQSAGGEAKTG